MSSSLVKGRRWQCVKESTREMTREGESKCS